MDDRRLFTMILRIAAAGIVLSLLCLIASGAGDHPDSYIAYLWCGSIVLASAMLSLALSRGRQD
jgi:hypothetical protein